MGTVMNGNKWSGACVNGNVVSGLAKNGIAFYKKEPSVYKRRIMVGDNLSGTTIYQDFPNGYHNQLPDSNTYNELVIMGSVVNGYIYEMVTTPNTKCIGIDGMYVSGGSPDMSEEIGKLYFYYYGDEKISNFEILKGRPLVVSSILDDNSSYRHLYIEDPNIRPIQVGDVITENTIFYFTFSDDFYTEMLNNETIELDNMGNNKCIRATSVSVTGLYFVTFVINGSVINTDYIYYHASNNKTTNKSKMMNIKSGSETFSGIVTKADKNDKMYKYILVDATTLGT